MKKKFILFSFLTFILIIFIILNLKFTSLKEQEKQKTFKNTTVKVEVKIVEENLISEKLTLTGEFFANESVSIQSEVSGRIDYIGFSDGETVKKNTGVIFVICVVTANSDHAANATFFVGEAISTIVWALIIIYFFTHYGNTSIDFETR